MRAILRSLNGALHILSISLSCTKPSLPYNDESTQEELNHDLKYVYDKTGKHLGGFACEYSGRGTRKGALSSLIGSVAGMVKRRGMGNVRGDLREKRRSVTDKGFAVVPTAIFEYESMTVKESHGTVLAALCYTKHMYPDPSSGTCKGNLTRRKR